MKNATSMLPRKPNGAQVQVQGLPPEPGKVYHLVDGELFQAVVNNLAEQKFKDVAAILQRLGSVSVMNFPPAPPPDLEAKQPNGAVV